MDRFRDAKYVVEHKQEIQTALDYVNHNAPDPDELEAGARRSTETLGDIQTTYDELIAAKESIGFSPGAVKEAIEHVGNAWDARPDLDSIGRLVDVAASVVPFVKQVEVLR